ncbi:MULTISPECIES: DUF4189 domain-containing protein [Luteibacter]|uniref:DUF4189 domain-containing protein n=2 Tax=Luteibacter TaxID=242605 RepID=UPI0009DE116B
MTSLRLFAILMIAYSPLSFGQCAPGIPGAGNPGCVPPSAPGSPYGQPGETGAVAPPAPPAIWEDRWGAIAIDRMNGAAGGDIDGTSKSEAVKVATQRCVESGGSSDHCTIVVSFVNQCAAVAQEPGSSVISSATAADATEATARVLNRCGRSHCSVLYNVCTYAVRVN